MNAISLLESGQPSSRDIECTFQSESLTHAFVLLPVQFLYVFQLFYLGPTNVNYHFHITDAQYSVMELTVIIIIISFCS
jgi:hypothetical protein